MNDTVTPETPGDIDHTHYLRTVGVMAGHCTVSAQKSIYTDNGVKLVDTGTRIDQRLYERLVQHRLRSPIDNQLTVENAVTVDGIIEAAQAMLAERPLPRLLAQAMAPQPERLIAPLRKLPLPAPMAFKLTVMREEQPKLFVHSVETTLLAIFLAIRAEMDEWERVSLAAAGMLHDIGMLHMNPAWIAPGHHMTGQERSHLMAHPVTSMLLMRSQQLYSSATEKAVLEHHERIDGSGYPRGLQDAQISAQGAVLLLAVTVASLFEKYDEQPAQRIYLMLRLNHRKFPAALTALLLPLLRDAAMQDGDVAQHAALARQYMQDLAQSFDTWSQLRAAQPARPAPRSAQAFIEERLDDIKRMLTEAGSHPEQVAELLQHLEDDPQGMAELAFMGREALWQMRSIVDTCQRRWPRMVDRGSPSDRLSADWCEWVLARDGSATGT